MDIFELESPEDESLSQEHDEQTSSRDDILIECARVMWAGKPSLFIPLYFFIIFHFVWNTIQDSRI